VLATGCIQQNLARFKSPFHLSLADHARGDAISHATAWIEPFGLGEHRHSIQALAGLAQGKEWRIAGPQFALTIVSVLSLKLTYRARH
jgi:hypothetical protein